MRLIRSLIRIIAITALSTFLTVLVVNHTLLSSSTWLDAAQSAGVYEQGAKALNTSIAKQTGPPVEPLTSGAVKVEVEEYVTAIEHYIRTGEVPPNLSGFAGLVSTTNTPSGAMQPLDILRVILSHQLWIGLVALVASLLVILLGRPRRRLRALAGVLFWTAVGMAAWYVVLRFAPGLLTDNLQVDANLQPFLPVFRNWLVAVFAIVNREILIVTIILLVATGACLLGGLVLGFARRREAKATEANSNLSNPASSD